MEYKTKIQARDFASSLDIDQYSTVYFDYQYFIAYFNFATKLINIDAEWFLYEIISN